MIGKVIHHYRILAEIGRGGMGVVYAAEDTKLNRRVALKFLHADRTDPANTKRLFREARAAAQLQHPHICPVYGFEEFEGQAFLVLAFIEGRPLSRLIAENALSLPQVLAITHQVASALDAAHRAGIVHRDIKSANILLTADDHAYILDFGLASWNSQSTSSLDNHFGGTPSYVAPEQALGQSVTPAADQFSLAVTVF
jgi:serine/threonine-protein kinase